jgi:hypothetical protein
MVHLHRKALGTGLATALILAVTAAPAALAQATGPYGIGDMRSPDARDAADARQVAQPTGPYGIGDLRSPDARDAADGRQIVVAGPPMWPVSPQTIPRPRAVASAPRSGVDWGSAGIGAAAVIGAFAIAAAGILGVRRRRVARPGSLSAR